VGQIHLVHWQEIQNTENFLVEVSNYRDASNENPFDSLVKVAFKVLCFRAQTQILKESLLLRGHYKCL
jgi:hypothetical protein